MSDRYECGNHGTRSHDANYAIIRETQGTAEILHLVGELDISAAGEFQVCVDQIYELGQPMVLDMSACHYIDSTILTVLVRAAKQFRERVSIIVPGGAKIRRILALTRLDEVLPLDESPAAASERLALEISV